MFFFFGKPKAAVAAGGVTNLVTNGTFDTDTDWTKGEGWTISGGKAVGTATVENLFQTPTTPIAEGHTYRLTYTAVVTSGDVNGYFGVTALTPRTTSGTYQESFVATVGDAGSDIYFGYYNEADFTGTIDDVILEDIT